MAQRRLLWKLYPAYVLLIALCVLGVTGYALRSVTRFYHAQVAEDLAARAWLIRPQIAERLRAGDTASLDALARDLARSAKARITIVGVNGRVLADSEKGPGAMDSHADRPEVIQALAEGLGQSTHYSSTLRTNMMYVAVAVGDQREPLGVIRTSIALDRVEAELAAMSRRIWLGGLVAAVLAAGLSMVVAKRVSRPLGEMAEGAEKFAAGDLSHKILPPDIVEFQRLAESLNRMAQNLDQKIAALSRQNAQYDAVLSSMAEGVIAVDRDHRIISLNQAAAGLLDADPAESTGRTLQEVSRNVPLARFVGAVLADGQARDGEIVLHNRGEAHVLVGGSALRDAGDRQIGALIVLSDITQVRRLEGVRRDFVANVSHELRTPITAVQGFIETLRDGAVSDPERARRFLDIASKHAARLNRIVEDLLALSRIEREQETGAIDLPETKLRDVLHAAASDCEASSREREMAVRIDCPEDLVVRANPHLLEQAVLNLLDNAIRYSAPGSSVDLQAERAEGEVLVRVTDRGCGIPAEHLPRIFERFYCVDKAHSRKLGGTGLGLAIVKHIAQVHGGKVTVESTPGEGSVFTIHLPS